MSMCRAATGVRSAHDAPIAARWTRAAGAFSSPGSATRWIAADDVGAQVAICADIQRQAFLDVPCIPLGEYRALTAHKADLSGFAPGTTLFFGVKRGCGHWRTAL